jgi:glutathione peroxidase
MMAKSLFELSAKTNDGIEQPFSAFKGKTVLIVNTASKCGFTPQYKGIEALYKKYKDRGFVVLGFPCDQFANQEPGTDTEIAAFCERNFGVTFPLMSKIDVNGDKTHPVFEFLKNKAPGIIGKSIKWNFTKFLVSPGGENVRRFAPATEPESMEKAIEATLGA